LLATLGPSCTNLTSDVHAPVAVEFVTVASPFVDLGDTLPLTVRVLDRAGDSVPGAVVTLTVLDTAYLLLDSARLAVVGKALAASARVVAASSGLRSDPLAIRVLSGHTDSLALAGPPAFSVAAADSVSGSLTVAVYDATTTPGSATALGDRPVLFTLVEPVFADASSATAVLGNNALSRAVTTASDGTASVTVKRRGSTQPDSVVVQASAARGNGAALRGSPVRFVVRFL